jgi:hypothetical protein
MGFGKHKDLLVSTVIREHPGYIEWCLLNVPGFELDERAQDEYEYEIEEYYA